MGRYPSPATLSNWASNEWRDTSERVNHRRVSIATDRTATPTQAGKCGGEARGRDGGGRRESECGRRENSGYWPLFCIHATYGLWFLPGKDAFPVVLHADDRPAAFWGFIQGAVELAEG